MSSSERPREVSRRDALRWAGTGAAAAAALWCAPELVQSTASAAPAGTLNPLRPPATPLIVRSPYLSTWQAADNLPGAWSTFWTGHITALCGIARIDGTAYAFAGAPQLPSGPSLTPMSQNSLQVTATRSIYELTGGGVTLTVTFFSPVDPGNLQRQCVPFGYVTISAASTDGRAHAVSLHFDTSAEWLQWDSATPVRWQRQESSGVTSLSVQAASPGVLAEDGHDQSRWGSLVVAAPSSGVTWQIGQDTVVRATSANGGALPGTSDPDQPRAISDRWPVLAFAKDLGTVQPGAAADPLVVAIGHVRTPAVSYLGAQLAPWWTHYWSSWQDMVAWFHADYPAALAAGIALDQRIDNEASVAGGEHYAAICALALRQAFGGTELVDRNGSPWAFLKEISSSGNVSTVDVIYPALPGYLHLSPDFVRLLLEPVLDYAERGGWPMTFSEHDIGASYPNAAGHNDGNEESMPVEESANMLIMSAAVAQRLDSAAAKAFVNAHYGILRQWAEYLVGNTLDPGNQNQTDDFTGWIAHSANLALKGIIGVGAMAVLADVVGNSADALRYRSISRSYISQWTTLADDGSHLRMAYDQPGTWSLKYNGFADRLLGLDLVPLGTAAREAAWYQSKRGAHGVPLDLRHDYTKADWELWTAAWLTDHTDIRATLVEGVYSFANTTGSRVPFSDWYFVADARQSGFQARPVAAGYLALLPRPAASTTSWRRIQNQRSGKLLAVRDMSLSDIADVTQWQDNGTVDHVWTVVDSGDGTVRIMNRNSGKVLAVHDQSLDNGAHVQQFQDNGTPDHLWRIVDAGGGWWKLQNVHSGKVMAVDQQSTADGAQVTQWDDNGTPDHLWRFI